MATTAELINKGACSAQEVLGTNISKGCITQFEAARSIWRIAPGEEFRAGEDFWSEFDRLMLAGKLVIAAGVNTIEETGSDNATETLADDTQILTNRGKYLFNATFTKGVYFHNALTSMRGFRNGNVIIVDNNGIHGTKTTTGGFTGYTTGMFESAKLVVGTNAAVQKEGLMFQLLERDEIDTYEGYAFIADRTAKKQEGIVQVELEYENTPADTDTTLTVNAVLAQARGQIVEGFDYTAFNFTVDGVASNPTAGDDSTKAGQYVLTVAALSSDDETVLKMPIVKGPDGTYYKSNSLAVTIA